LILIHTQAYIALKRTWVGGIVGRSAVFIAIYLIIGVSLAGCQFPWDSPSTTRAAEEAINALRHDLNYSDDTQLEHDASRLNGLSSHDFNSNDLQLRTTLIADTAVKFLNNWADNWVKSTEEHLPKDAHQDASNDTNSLFDHFVAALADVTEDAIRGQTCKDILDLVAPNPNPTATDEPDDEGWLGNIEQDAENVLDKTFGWKPAYVNQVMKWDDWYNDVTSAAQQAASSITNDPVPYIEFLSYPSGRRATAIYARYCYAPPTTA